MIAKKLKLFLLVITLPAMLLLLVSHITQQGDIIAQTSCEDHADATCTGSKSCTACKNCSSCKHCSKNGGSCGVCK
ncbi:MAG: hypothetical protein KF862_15105 [Chitinophagaceae bacterium]|nr:hypothetical protein [Chitinophagaceae bacterium]